jgi:hypothetical protein
VVANVAIAVSNVSFVQRTVAVANVQEKWKAAVIVVLASIATYLAVNLAVNAKRRNRDAVRRVMKNVVDVAMPTEPAHVVARATET